MHIVLLHVNVDLLEEDDQPRLVSYESTALLLDVITQLDLVSYVMHCSIPHTTCICIYCIRNLFSEFVDAMCVDCCGSPQWRLWFSFGGSIGLVADM